MKRLFPFCALVFLASALFYTPTSPGATLAVPPVTLRQPTLTPAPVKAPDTTPDSCVTPPAGLVGWWKGDGNALDSAGANNGVNQNITFTNGVVGLAFACDPENYPYGTYTGIRLADQPAYALTNSLTIEGWVRPRADSWVILHRGDNRPGYDPFSLSMQLSHDLRFEIQDASNNSAFIDTTLAYGEWTYIAATLDGSSGTMSLYTNGVLASQAVTTVRPAGVLPAGNSPGVGIGNENDGINNFPFIGDIDEISLYNRALTENEIQSIYNAGSAGKCSIIAATNDCVTPPADLIGWWKGDGNALDSIDGTTGIVFPGTTYADGMVGQAFSFDGVSGCVMNTNTPSLTNIQNTFTMEFWAYPQKGFEMLPEGGGLGNSGQSYAIFPDWGGINSSGPAGVGVSVGTNGISVIEHCNNYMPSSLSYTNPISGWVHIAVVYSNKQPILYVNGVKVRTGVTSSQTFVYPSKDLGNSYGNVFGFYQFNIYGPYKGLLDEVSIYNRALSSDEIATIYNAGSAGKCTSTLSAVPQISNISPAAATNGAVVVISGNNFNPNSAGDTVYFGAVQAGVLIATSTNLIVTVPVGATYAPITVTVNGLTAYSGQLFEPTFLGNGAAINSASFAPRLDLPAGQGPNKVVIADLDGDGKPDLIVANDYGNSISLYRNISTNAVLTAASFAPPVNLITPPGQYSPFGLAVADVDGDGKLDIIVSDYNNSLVSVYHNECTPGNISSNLFATRVDFATGQQPQGVEVRDLDGDGKPEILVANTGDGTISILQNTSVAGSLTTNSFAAKVDIATGAGCDSILVGDLDGDGKPDVVAVNGGGDTISLLRNLMSSPGEITANSFAPKVDVTVLSGLVQAAIGDLDGDGKLDLIVASYLPETLAVLHNTSTVGNFSFAPPVDFSLGGRGHSPILTDLNGDGKPDIAVVTELNSLLSIFQNTGLPGVFNTNSLAARVDFGTGWNAWGVAAGDLDGDGRPDLVFCNTYDNTISIYQNQSPINSPPIITSQPANQTALEGAAVTFSVMVEGVAPLTYQWRFNGTTISGATNATLTVTNLHPNQAGSYTVRVTNPFGSVTSSNATLTVTSQSMLAYEYAGTEKITTAKQEFSYNYSGEMFLIPSSTNGFFVGWASINGKRQYWVTPFSDYLLITIPGAANHVYTLIGKAGDEIDSSGQPHIWSYLHKGQNTVLTIGSRKTFSFPNTFSCNDNHVYPDPTSGNLILREAVSTYKYAAATTQTANNNGQTLADLVKTLTNSLVKQGYKAQ